MAKVSAIVLAAGLSSRMGPENKLFMKWKGKPILRHVIEQVSKSQADEVIVVTSPTSFEPLQKLIGNVVQLVVNPDFKTGMTSSIKKGVEVANGDAFLICLGDQPMIRTSTYDSLVQAISGEDNEFILVPTFDEKRGNPVLFSASFRRVILNHNEPEGCRGIVKSNAHKVIELAVNDPGILLDLDTPEDFNYLNQTIE